VSTPAPAVGGWLGVLLPAVRRSERAADAGTALSIGALGLLLVATDLGELVGGWPGLLGGSRWWHLLPLALGCLVVLLLKRRRPVLALVLGAVVVTSEAVLVGPGVGGYLVLADLLFGVETFAAARARAALRWVLGTLLLGAVVLVAALTGDLRAVVLTAVQGVLLLGVPVWWARDLRRSAELAALERRRADDVRRIARLDHETALREERATVARDLHDAVTSHVSAAALHAAAGLADGGDGRAALRQARASSLAALAEMRRMIDVLRSTGGEDARRAPGAEAITDLVDAARATGLQVDLDAADASALPLPLAQATHRILGEALTNAAKHAPGGRVRVHLDPGDPVVLEVDSAAGGDTRPVPWPTGGHGLATMAERARAVGGDAVAGPRPDGGWRVRAVLPHRPGSPS
jgi:signal transduction histidine kinase